MAPPTVECSVGDPTRDGVVTWSAGGKSRSKGARGKRGIIVRGDLVPGGRASSVMKTILASHRKAGKYSLTLSSSNKLNTSYLLSIWTLIKEIGVDEFEAPDRGGKDGVSLLLLSFVGKT